MGTGSSEPARGRRLKHEDHRPDDRTMAKRRTETAAGRRSPAGEARDFPDRAAAADMAAQRRSFLEFVDRIGLKAKPGDPTGAELIWKGREWHLRKIRNL